VLGYYDPKTKELVVGSSGDDGDIDIATRLTLVHELDHALTDQWFDFGTATQALDDADREEELDAYTAILEGDAKLLEARYTEKYLSEEEQVVLALGALGGEANGDTLAKLARTPPFLLAYLYFPYEAGLAFAEAQAASAGSANAGIDSALRRPPTSTEQILHPDLYAAGQGWSPPPLVDVATATGCESRRRGTLGEFKMGALLGTELDDETASSGAAGWNGDTFEAVRCGTSLGLVDRWQTDSDADATRLVRALTEWAPGWSGGWPPVDGRFSGPDGAGRIVRDGARVDLILADDAATAERLAAVAR